MEMMDHGTCMVLVDHSFLMSLLPWGSYFLVSFLKSISNRSVGESEEASEYFSRLSLCLSMAMWPTLSYGMDVSSRQCRYNGHVS